MSGGAFAVEIDRAVWWRTQLLPLRRLGRAVWDRPAWLVPVIAPPVAFGVLSAAVLQADLDHGVAWNVAGPMLLLAFVLAAFSGLGSLMWPRRRHSRALLSARRGPGELQLEPGGVAFAFGGRPTRRLPWSAFTEVTRERGAGHDLVVLWLGPLPVLTVPGQTFETPAERAAFVAAARAGITSASTAS